MKNAGEYAHWDDLDEKVVAENIPNYSDRGLISIIMGREDIDDSVVENALRGNRKEIAMMKGTSKNRLLAALELHRRLGETGVKISSPGDVFNSLRFHGNSKQEQFWAIDLDGAHCVIEYRLVSLGLINRTIVHPREVFVGAIENHAVAIIVAHNHPSGSMEPSPEDIEITRRLVDAGKNIGISVLDHIIFTGNGFASFVEKGICEF